MSKTRGSSRAVKGLIDRFAIISRFPISHCGLQLLNFTAALLPFDFMRASSNPNNRISIARVPERKAASQPDFSPSLTLRIYLFFFFARDAWPRFFIMGGVVQVVEVLLLLFFFLLLFYFYFFARNGICNWILRSNWVAFVGCSRKNFKFFFFH